MAKTYALTKEHRAQLKPWADKWIANALSTEPMTEEDREAVRDAVEGMYRAANLAPPPRHRIVFTPSPFVSAVAAGFAAAVWYVRRHHAPAATDAATWEATDAATREATWAATDAATRAATDAATDAATQAATVAATWAATQAATVAATGAATDAATREATGAATWAATREATDAATQAAIRAATDTRWYRGMENIPEMALAILGPLAPFGVSCAATSYRLQNGGNQWSGYAAYLSFFRHIAQLPIDYSRWQHYEAAARHGGPRYLHEQFCIVSDRPRVLTVDAQFRPHGEHGPFCQWSDGTALYAWHGTRVPWWVIEQPERITVGAIRQEANAEVRRVMMQRMGWDQFVRESGAEMVHADETGTLYRVQDTDEDIYVVSVLNSTAEGDGSRKQYVLPVDPQLRPLPDGTWSADRQVAWLAQQLPQAPTAHNAVASTFGLRGEAYQPCVET